MAGPVLGRRVSQLRALALLDRAVRRGARAVVSGRSPRGREPGRGPGRQGPAAARGVAGAWRARVLRPGGYEPGPARDGMRRRALGGLPGAGDQGGLHEPDPFEGARCGARVAAPACVARRRGHAPGARRATRHEPLVQVRRGDVPPDSLRGRAHRPLAGTERRPAISHGARVARMTKPLEVEGLGYRLPGKGKRETGNGRFLVRDVSFAVGAGEALVLLGRSGSGKTTTLKLINRLLEPTSGEVRVAGQRAADLPVMRLRRRIGYVIQEVGLFPHFTVERNVGLVPQLEAWPPARIAARVRELLALVGLDPDTFGRRYPHELSGGQRQRVGVARALAADPPLLLLDEPFGALDPITRVELQREFAALEGRLGKGMGFVTHDVREGLLLGTRIGLMLQGRLAFLRTPDEFRRSSHPECRAFMAAA